MALRNWRVQRAPWDARVLLEAAAAAHRPQAAAEVLAFIERTRLQDPIIGRLVDDLRGQLAAAGHDQRGPVGVAGDAGLSR
jgi:hypothetical protein